MITDMKDEQKKREQAELEGGADVPSSISPV